METLTADDVRAWRMRAQGLTDDRDRRDAVAAVRQAGALQAQDAKAGGSARSGM